MNLLFDKNVFFFCLRQISVHTHTHIVICWVCHMQQVSTVWKSQLFFLFKVIRRPCFVNTIVGKLYVTLLTSLESDCGDYAPLRSMAIWDTLYEVCEWDPVSGRLNRHAGLEKNVFYFVSILSPFLHTLPTSLYLHSSVPTYIPYTP